MGRLILSKLCSLISRLLDQIGMGAFNLSTWFDGKSYTLVGSSPPDVEDILRKL